MSTRIKDYTILAGTALPLYIPGKFFMIMEGADAYNVTFIRNGSRFGQADNVERGFAIGPMGEGFEGIEIATVSGATSAVKLAFTDDPVDYQRLTGSVDVTPVTPSEALPLGDLAFGGPALKIADADADRAYLVVYNAGANPFRWGTLANKPNVAVGAEVPPGVGVSIDCTAEIWAYSAGTTISLTNVKR